MHPALEYPDFEHKKLAANNALLDELQAFYGSAPGLGESQGFEGIVRDGFYPYYFAQKLRILFIGREALGLDSCNYLDVLAHCYRKEKWGDKKPLNSSFFHARMLHMAYGILNDFPDWDHIPWAAEIGDTFGTADGLSFAFMNISKISNESNSWPADWATINSALDASISHRNFPREQIHLLEPDVIIAMNIKDKLDRVLGPMVEFHTTDEAEGCLVEISGRRTLVINTWHFSTYNKKHVKLYYEPVCEIFSEHAAWKSAASESRHSQTL